MSIAYEIIPSHPQLPIRIFYSNEGRANRVPPHLHNSLELIFLLTGRLTMTLETTSWELLPGQVAIVGVNRVHSTCSEDPSTTAYMLQVSASFLAEICPGGQAPFFPAGPDLPQPQQEQLEQLRFLLAGLLDLEQGTGKYLPLKRAGLLLQALSLVFTLFGCEEDGPRPGSGSRLPAILHYLGQNFRSELPLERAAGAAGLSASYYSRYIRKHLGMTFTAYLDMLRLGWAREKLLSTNLDIGQVCEESGFANYTVFLRKFKEAYGTTPSGLRKQGGTI